MAPAGLDPKLSDFEASILATTLPCAFSLVLLELIHLSRLSYVSACLLSNHLTNEKREILSLAEQLAAERYIRSNI